MSDNQGRLITLEGIEGSGKSTNLNYIANCLQQKGIDHICTREPGGTALSEKLRSLLLDNSLTIEPLAELLMMFASRAQLLAEQIIPNLSNGVWVICDRFTDASYAYQGGGRQLGLEAVASLQQLVQQQLRPDLTLIFDIPVTEGLLRAKRRNTLDRFEAETIDFFQRVRETYQTIAADNKDRCRLLDATQPLPAVQKQVLHQLEQFIDRNQEWKPPLI